MRILGNIIWFLLGGLISALCFYLVGAVLCITLIFIPFGIQCFKIGTLVMWPFGHVVHTDYDSHPVANIWWSMFNGGGSALYMLIGCIACITLIGIPFGRQCFKIARLSFIPFGATVEKIDY